MTRRLTPAEQLAAVARDATLASIVAATSDWDLAVVKQAVIAHGRALDEFSANDFRDALPEQGSGLTGAAIRGLAASKVIVHTGKYVPSTAEGTNGHKIAVYRLARTEQEAAA